MDESWRRHCLHILSDPASKIRPEWLDAALTNWLMGNIWTFIKDNPHVYNYLVENGIGLHDIGLNIPISPEYTDTIIKLMTHPKCESYTLKHLCKRLVEHGMPDLIAEMPAHGLNDVTIPDSYIECMSSPTLIKLLNKICWQQSMSVHELVCAIVSRLSDGELVEVVRQSEVSNEHCNICRSESKLGITHNIKRLPKRAISILLSKLPTKYAQPLYEVCKRTFHELVCMKCENSRFKSKSGYTLHRKKCDPANKYPSINEIMQRRMTPERVS